MCGDAVPMLRSTSEGRSAICVSFGTEQDALRNQPRVIEGVISGALGQRSARHHRGGRLRPGELVHIMTTVHAGEEIGDPAAIPRIVGGWGTGNQNPPVSPQGVDQSRTVLRREWDDTLRHPHRGQGPTHPSNQVVVPGRRERRRRVRRIVDGGRIDWRLSDWASNPHRCWRFRFHRVP